MGAISGWFAAEGAQLSALGYLPTQGTYVRIMDVYRPKNDGLLPPAGVGPHATAPGLLSPTEHGWIANRRCKVDFSGPPSRLCLCAADPGSFRMRKPTGPAHQMAASCAHQVCNKEHTNTRPAPVPSFPRPFTEFCLRQSPPATFIEAAKQRPSTRQSSAPHPAIKKHAEQRKEDSLAQRRLRKGTTGPAKGWLDCRAQSAKGDQGKDISRWPE